MNRSSLLEITWTDPATETTGYVVLDTLVRGLASGGLRLRKGCTLEEVRGLAQGMTRKEAVVYDPSDHYVPLGGGKGGIDIDPADPRAEEVLTRFMAAVLPVIRSQWNTGEDFGLHQETIDRVAQTLGLDSTVEAVFATLPDAAAARERLAAAFAVMVDGISLGDVVGGYGVAQAALRAWDHYRDHDEPPTVVVQGFGTIGGAAARYIARSGAKVIAVADREGLVYREAGLDVDAMLATRDSLGIIDRSLLPDDVTERSNTDWLRVPCDILVPAAMSYVIDDGAQVQAKMVIEGANMPTLAEAEETLMSRGIPVVPDFVANVMTNAWWWWIVFGDIEPTQASSFAKIDSVMRRVLGEVWEAAERDTVSLRTAALALAARHSAEVAERVGITAMPQ